MPLLEAIARREPTAADGALRIKQVLHQAVTQMEHSLTQVRRIVERHGRAEIAAALGNEADELQQVYGKLKAAVADLDRHRDVPDLPS